MSRKTQLAVIGAGPGGYTAAFLAADLGMTVTLIDEAPKPGGVCLYRGCMPSKALLHVAKVVIQAKDAERWGVRFGEPNINLDALRTWKMKVVDKLTDGLIQLSKQRSVDYLQGRATLVEQFCVSVVTSDGDAEQVHFDHAILATGSRPASPPSLSLEDSRVLDSTAALEVDRVPTNLLVIGGGYIGLELGMVYAALGSVVTLVEMTSSLLPGVDWDLVRVLTRRLTSTTISIHVNTTVTSLESVDGGIKVGLAGQRAQEIDPVFDGVLVAVGRIPNSGLAGLDRTRVELDANRFIKVDQQRRTAEPSLFAIGDLTGEPMLAHKAFHEARVAVEAIVGRRSVFNPLAIPAVVFTDPEIAWCGLTETQATAMKREVSVAKYPWGASGRAVTLDRAEGVTKLIVDLDTERVLGIGIAGIGAGELIAEAVVAIEMGATVSDLRRSIHPHPTLSETLLESAEMFLGQSTHIYRPKR